MTIGYTWAGQTRL